MDIYLVGGAVRDQLLGMKIYDRDWMVVGCSPEEMIKKGFRPVGQDFPVFLHPETQEEYALARTERKSGQGYTGFECYYAPDVTLEDDLVRRDLTINAIAQDEDGKLHDPFNGQMDIENRILRHVSPAFSEDPLRVLRVARFAAKFFHLGFTIAPETLTLMQGIAESGELSHLTPERVWQEWHKSLSTQDPQIFLEVLRQCGALKIVLPEIDALFGVPQPEKWHPEIDTGIHTLMVAKQAALLSPSTAIRFAAQVHDLGKGVTPKEEWPSHKMHCHTGMQLIEKLCQRVKVPNECRDLALLVCQHHSNIHRTAELKPSTVLKLFNLMDVWRKPDRFEQVLICCQADHQGRLNFESHPYVQADQMRDYLTAALSINVSDIIQAGYKGQAIKDELDVQRTKAIKNRKNA
ncbi:MAG: multifunctional CCA addition/repair protein [Vibrio sp.]